MEFTKTVNNDDTKIIICSDDTKIIIRNDDTKIIRSEDTRIISGDDTKIAGDLTLTITKTCFGYKRRFL